MQVKPKIGIVTIYIRTLPGAFAKTVDQGIFYLLGNKHAVGKCTPIDHTVKGKGLVFTHIIFPREIDKSLIELQLIAYRNTINRF